LTKPPPTVDAIYYGGFDPGSGIACLKVVPADGVEMERDSVALPSFIADGDTEELLNSRGEFDATLKSVLRENEFALTLNEVDYYLGDLIKSGYNQNDAKRDKNRYWNEHALVLLLALAADLIPERCFELRLVTALPVTLYHKDNRKRMKESLQGYYRFAFATRGREYRDREAIIKVGYVAAEGQGILIHCGDSVSEQAVIDIGERTTDLLAATGQSLLPNLCNGRELGVGQIVDDLKAALLKRGRNLTTQKAHDLLKAYAHTHDLPVITDGDGIDISAEELIQVIEKGIARVGKSIATFISTTWNVESAKAASDFDAVYLAGGGAYYFEPVVRQAVGVRKVQIVSDPEYSNSRGYVDLSLALEDSKPTIWKAD
jgi:hypothetical protein